MNEVFTKSCHKCGNIQTYINNLSFKRAVKNNSICGNCTEQKQKKIYTTDIIDKITELYTNNMSLSKIANFLKIKRNNVKLILIDKGIWCEGRDNIKKDFTYNETKNIIKKYNEGLSSKKIADFYNVSITPIKKILKDNDILKKGYGNGVKIDLTEEQKEIIKHLYVIEYKNSEEIGEKLNLTKSFVSKYLQSTDYYRNKSEGVSVGLVKRYRNISYNDYLKINDEYKKYKNDVMRVTRQQSIDQLKNFDKRGNSGVDGAYHLDHKFSILEGFKNNISPNIIGGIKNLECIPWRDNIKKRTKNSININELIL